MVFACFLTGSCSEFLEIDKPKDQLVKTAVFVSDQSAEAAMVGIYSEMSDISSPVSAKLHLATGLYSDELSFTGNDGAYNQMLENNLQNTNGLVQDVWTYLYRYIYYSNSIIEGLESSKEISEPIKLRLTGEAKLIRAFCYFYLCSLWGDVPLVTGSDYRQNESSPRVPVGDLYSFIIADLQQAVELLDDVKLEDQRIRPDRYTASALLARVYLYVEDWEKALQAASDVIQSGEFSLETLSDCFLNDSRETIWQLASVNPNYNTLIGQQLIPASETQIPNYPLSESFADSFEEEDQRVNIWTDTVTAAGMFFRYPYKYKVRSGNNPLQEFLIISRLAELYLIRAEALARLGNLSAALEDLNIIRNRAGLADYPVSSEDELFLAIQKERRAELFLEWGHRWFDLKRWGRADDILQELKAPEWQSNDILWPIPLSQIEANPYLTQNAGY